ncbi:MAG: hypothetical protein JOZ93_01610, partial [Sinobacteraceae bacterium]|nr:hypothetical protein [Nevskiaceae bacterium]
MKKHYLFRQAFALFLTLCLLLPGTVFGDGNGQVNPKSAKKNFAQGQKYETAQQWDLAAQSYFMAVSADPSNAEYRLHLARALQNASLMFSKRGDTFLTQNDYASAYTAFKQAYTFDQTNEVAKLKMERMIELQKAQAGITDTPNLNPRNGNIIQTSADIQRPLTPRSKDLATLVEFKDSSLKMVIGNLARQMGLNVIFDETVREVPKYSISLQNVTQARALDYILLQNKLTFEQLDRRTIYLYLDNPPNRQRFEHLLVKTFYINNAKADEARQQIQALLTGGVQRQMAVSKDLNSLTVRATGEDLKVIQDILDAIDKNRSEVAIDIEIYEVSHATSLQLGNQIATSQSAVNVALPGANGRPSSPVTGNSTGLSNLGGIGQFATNTLLGNTFNIGGGLGTLIGIPPTTLSLMQTKDNGRLLNRVQIHALDGQANKTKVGQSVPVRLGSTYVPGFTTGTTTGGTTGGVGGIGGSAYPGSFDSVQYQDAGLVIDVTPTITNDGYIEMKMNLESKTVVESSQALQPSFTQRSLTT